MGYFKNGLELLRGKCIVIDTGVSLRALGGIEGYKEAIDCANERRYRIVISSDIGGSMRAV